MSEETYIQTADSAVNPIMGCEGCELFPNPAEIFLKINEAVSATGHSINSRAIYEDLISLVYSCIQYPLAGHRNAANTTNIWHLRDRFLMRVMDKTDADLDARNAAERVINESITCYAAAAHLKYGQSLLKEDYVGDSGHAPIFESVTEFPGRAEKIANLKDLLGCSEGRCPWKANLPRLISVSDMGDAMSGLGHSPFLKNDLIPAITSDAGKRHLWLWLTKRPSRLAEFAEQIGGLPENVCAMTTLTSANTENLKRMADLKKVQARMRGLSIEPLWARIDPKSLDLKGIDWVIVGGESGSGELARPFALEWAEELLDYCRKKRVAFFCKQLGSKPTRNGEPLILEESHGGNWDEWPDEGLKVREFPKAFHKYRKTEMKRPTKPRSKETKKMEIELPLPTAEETAEFERLDKIVTKGIRSFVEAGEALLKIHDGKLWHAGGFKTWDCYCRSVAGMSRIHARRLMKASQCVGYLKSFPEFTILPNSESQVRPLLRLTDPEDWHSAWDLACHSPISLIDKPPTASEVNQAVDEVMYYDEEEIITIKPPTRSEQRVSLVSKLRTAVSEKKSWGDVEKLLTELEKMI